MTCRGGKGQGQGAENEFLRKEPNERRACPAGAKQRSNTAAFSSKPPPGRSSGLLASICPQKSAQTCKGGKRHQRHAVPGSDLPQGSTSQGRLRSPGWATVRRLREGRRELRALRPAPSAPPWAPWGTHAAPLRQTPVSALGPR